MVYLINPDTLTILSGPHGVQSTFVKKLTNCGNPELLNLADYNIVPAVYPPLTESQRYSATPVVTADAVTFPGEAIPLPDIWRDQARVRRNRIANRVLAEPLSDDPDILRNHLAAAITLLTLRN